MESIEIWKRLVMFFFKMMLQSSNFLVVSVAVQSCFILHLVDERFI
jgi:hypothetical protein